MQEQRSTVEPCIEAFELDHTSSSSSIAIDQQVYWTNVLNTGNVQNLPDYLQAPSQEDMPMRSVISHETGNLNDWNLGSSSSRVPVMNQTSHNDIEMENGWGTSANAGASINLEGRRLEAANLLSLDHGGINLNSNPVGQGQSFLQTSSSNDVSQNSDPNARLTGNHAQVSQPGICPFYNPFGPELEHISSSNGSTSVCGTSTGGMSYLPEGTDGRPGSSVDGRRLSGKRKNIEGFPGQSSGSASHSCFQQTENDLLHNVAARNRSSGSLNIIRSSDYLSNVNSTDEHLNTRYSSGSRAEAAECLSSFGGSGSVEGLQRNFRMRINNVHQADSSAPNMWALGTSNRSPSIWSSHQPSSLLIPLNHSLESRPTIPRTSSESQSHLSSVPGAPHVVHPLPWNGTSSSRIGGYSSSPALGSERSATLREEGSSRGTIRNITSEHPNFLPADELRNAAQGPTNWGLANDNVGFPGNMASTSRVGSSSSVHSSVPPTWLPHQNPPSQYPQSFSEFVHRAFPTSVSDNADQPNNFLPQRPVHSSSSQEIAPQPGSVVRAHQQPLLRSAFLMDRRSDLTGASLRLRSLAAAREGRTRMISEGILVVCAACNYGPRPSSVCNDAPWIMTVGASTMDRALLMNLRLGDGEVIPGESLYSQPGVRGRLVYPGLYGGEDADYCTNLAAFDVRGKVVMCHPGQTNTVQKADVVEQAGGIAVVVLSWGTAGSIIVDVPDTVLPAVAVNYPNSLKLIEYVNQSTSNPYGTVTGVTPAPAVPYFSSRGPSLVNGGILKPDILGPGVNVLAAKHNSSSGFHLLSGTSMATPHLSGMAAIVKLHQLRRTGMEWTPAMVRSAIMTTAQTTNSDGDGMTDETGGTADLFATGAGHVNPAGAMDPGLVYDIQFEDYVRYLCGLGYSDKEILQTAAMSVDCDQFGRIEPEQLNYPSIAVTLSYAVKRKVIRRTVTNVRPEPTSYTAEVSFSTAQSGVTVSVSPGTLDFDTMGETKSFEVTFTAVTSTAVVPGDAFQGSLRWVSSAAQWPVVTSPLLVVIA